jgi:hypothetical protein
VPKYDVHLYAVLRFTVRRVEAKSMEDACKNAEQVVNDEAIKTAMRGGSEYEADFADEVIEALVDVQGDEDYSESTWLEPEGDVWVKKEGSNDDAQNIHCNGSDHHFPGCRRNQ